MDKLIVASLLRHCDSDHTPHVGHVNLQILPKLPRKTRCLFELENHARDLSALCWFVWTLLPEWQAEGAWMQTKIATLNR